MQFSKYTQIMTRTALALLLCLFIGANTCMLKAQDTIQVVTEYAPFMLFNRVNSSESGYQTPEEVKKDWHIYAVRKGTKVVALGYDGFDGLLRVKLPDGSIGYMPTISFALGYTFNHTLDTKEYPTGQYTLTSIGPIQYLKDIDQYIPVQPENYYIRHESGKMFTITTKNLSHIECQQRFARWNGASIFEGFFEQHPNIKEIPDRNDRGINFKLKDGELPIGYIGCSRSYIESVLGQPAGYAGPAISQYKGYTFSCHNNVAWDTSVSKGNDAAGLVIYYDENLRAVYMEKKPISWYFEEILTTLITPSNPIDTLQPDVAEKIARSEVRGAYHYKSNTQPVQETYTAPHFFDKLRIGATYFIENTLGIRNMWLIALIMILVQYILITPANLVRMYNDRIPGWILRILVLLLTIPFTIFTISYITRLHFILAILSGLFIISPTIILIATAFSDTEKRRCKKCKTWHKEFIVLRSEERDRYFTSPEINFDSQIQVFNRRSSGPSGNTWVSTSDRGYNYKTTVKLVKVMRCRCKCPNCGYEFDETREHSTSLPGPICFSGHVSTKQEWTETEVKRTRYMHDGTTIYEEEDKRDVRRSSSGGSSSRRFDTDRYNQYARRYQRENNIKILTDYQSEYFGNYFG